MCEVGVENLECFTVSKFRGWCFWAFLLTQTTRYQTGTQHYVTCALESPPPPAPIYCFCLSQPRNQTKLYGPGSVNKCAYFPVVGYPTLEGHKKIDVCCIL